jgi:GxxExxY protein
MIYELRQRNLSVVAEQVVPIRYKDVILEDGYRLDLLVENEIIVEIKAIEVASVPR